MDLAGKPFEYGGRFKTTNPFANIDELYGNYESVQEALTNIPSALRKVGRTAGIYTDSSKIYSIEYWFQGGILDIHFVIKQTTIDLSPYAKISDVNAALLLKENTANKSTDGTLGGDIPSDTLFPSQKAAKTYADSIKTNFWYEEFIFTATQELGTTFTLLHAPINFLPSFLNEAKLSPVSDIQVDTSTLILTLNRQITIGFEYKLQLYYNF